MGFHVGYGLPDTAKSQEVTAYQAIYPQVSIRYVSFFWLISEIETDRVDSTPTS
jgi:hypothetical protein